MGIHIGVQVEPVLVINTVLNFQLDNCKFVPKFKIHAYKSCEDFDTSLKCLIQIISCAAVYQSKYDVSVRMELMCVLVYLL